MYPCTINTFDFLWPIHRVHRPKLTMFNYFELSAALLISWIGVCFARKFHFGAFGQMPELFRLVTSRIVVLSKDTWGCLIPNSIRFNEALTDDLLPRSYPIMYILLETLSFQLCASSEETSENRFVPLWAHKFLPVPFHPTVSPVANIAILMGVFTYRKTFTMRLSLIFLQLSPIKKVKVVSVMSNKTNFDTLYLF